MLMEPELSGTGRMMSIIDKEIKLQLYPISGWKMLLRSRKEGVEEMKEN